MSLVSKLAPKELQLEHTLGTDFFRAFQFLDANRVQINIEELEPRFIVYEGDEVLFEAVAPEELGHDLEDSVVKVGFDADKFDGLGCYDCLRYELRSMGENIVLYGRFILVEL